MDPSCATEEHKRARPHKDIQEAKRARAIALGMTRVPVPKIAAMESAMEMKPLQRVPGTVLFPPCAEIMLLKMEKRATMETRPEKTDVRARAAWNTAEMHAFKKG